MEQDQKIMVKYCDGYDPVTRTCPHTITNAQAARIGIAIPGVDFPTNADPNAPYVDLEEDEDGRV